MRTDQQSYTSEELGIKHNHIYGGGGNVVNGFTDPGNPTVNAMASDNGPLGHLHGREFLGLWVYELGNALSYITNITQPTPPDARERYEVGGEQGSAFEDCVFGGR